ncbi:MAG: DNRLRE domain-containing protein [Ignavibacteria bacterium]
MLNKYNSFVISVLIFTSISLISMNCADEPSSLGLEFLPPGETTGVRIFDSYFDTMQITSTNLKKFVNTSASVNLIVGQLGNYSSKGLIKFTNLNSNYDSASVISAVLKLKYNNYYFPNTASDSLAQISFDIFTVQTNLNYSTITLDSVNSSSFGTTSKGSYTGSPTADSQEVNINLDTTLVNNWLKYAADTSHSVKNYGIVLSPNSASLVLKAFYSSRESASTLKPTLYFIVNKFGDIDTVTHSTSETIFLANTTLSPVSGVFNLQAGVSYLQTMKFDLSKIPSTATINDVQLFLTLDSSRSIFTTKTSKRIAANYISDTAGLKTDLYTFYGDPPSSNPNQYVMRLVSRFQASPFQRWLQGQTNYGLLFRANNNAVNLDLFAFHDSNSPDPNKRPRVIIKYTPRITP